MSTVSEGLYSLFKHNYMFTDESTGGYIRNHANYPIVDEVVTRLLAEETAPDAFWLVGSQVYLPMLDVESAGNDWDVLYGTELGGTQALHDSHLAGWTTAHNHRGMPHRCKSGVKLDIFDSRFLKGAQQLEDTNPLVSFLSKAPISTWCVANCWGTDLMFTMPGFKEARARNSIDVANQGTFLEYLAADREEFRQTIGHITKQTGLKPDGEVLALLNLSETQFQEYVN